MILACFRCAQQGLPSFLMEFAPYSDLRVLDGLCGPIHVEEARRRLEALAAQIQAQPGPEEPT